MQFEEHNGIPKVIWIYWHTGFESAPLLVKQCLASWRKYHPSWKIQLLDQHNLDEFVDRSSYPDLPNFKVQYGSDLIRLDLLTKYGGVWADATTFCTKPLESWLAEYLIDGLFAFDSIKKERWVQSWFIAANKESPFIKLWRDAMFNQFETTQYRKMGYWSRQAIRKLMSMRKRGSIDNDFWFSDLMVKTLRIHPYPMVMYVFEYALSKNATLLAQWEAGKRLIDREAEELQTLGIHQAASTESKTFLDMNTAPLYKLNWRHCTGQVEAGSNFDYLLSHFGE